VIATLGFDQIRSEIDGARMPKRPDLPSVPMLTQIAADFGIDLTAADAASYRRRPKSDDNPFNGWYSRCHIDGAANGLLKGQRVAVKDVVCLADDDRITRPRRLRSPTSMQPSSPASWTPEGRLSARNCEDFAFSGAGHTCSNGPVCNPRNPAHNRAAPQATAQSSWSQVRPI
jgi:hypothetical protein